MKDSGMHPAQASALYALRHASSARFSDLLKTTTLTSDVFKFHVRKLVKLGYVVKQPDGLYVLTPIGKEYANRLDETTGRPIEQPKASMLMLVRSRHDGREYILAHRRTREPFRDFWGIASAPVLRGVPIAESAARELHKQTGLTAHFDVRGFYRVIDQTPDGAILEDKMFTLLIAELDGRSPVREWPGGESVWLTRDELLAKDKLFPITAGIFAMIDGKEMFREDVCRYASDLY